MIVCCIRPCWDPLNTDVILQNVGLDMELSKRNLAFRATGIFTGRTTACPIDFLRRQFFCRANLQFMLCGEHVSYSLDHSAPPYDL